MLQPDYCKMRLIEIGAGRRSWQYNPSPKNAPTFYDRVVRPLRKLQDRGVVEKVQEITAADEKTPLVVQIIGEVDLTKLNQP